MKEKFINELLDYIKLIIGVLLITTILNTAVFTFSTVQQRSMEHTLSENDVLIVEKLSLILSEPTRGDIVVFVEDEAVAKDFVTRIQVLYQDMIGKVKRENYRQRLVKRIIGLPGDEINIEDGFVYINGDKQKELYIDDLTFAKVLDYPYTVREDHYFVLGDNRDVSKDSRHFGDVKIDHFEGKAVFRVFPFSGFGIVE